MRKTRTLILRAGAAGVSKDAEDGFWPCSLHLRDMDRISVYILRCADGSYYTGITRTSLETRIAKHNLGTYDGYTARRRPVDLVWSRDFDRIVDAIAAERRIKGWSRAKKEALIAGDFALLQARSRRSYRPASHPSRRPCGPPQDEDDATPSS